MLNLLLCDAAVVVFVRVADLLYGVVARCLWLLIGRWLLADVGCCLLLFVGVVCCCWCCCVFVFGVAGCRCRCSLLVACFLFGVW